MFEREPMEDHKRMDSAPTVAAKGGAGREEKPTQDAGPAPRAASPAQRQRDPAKTLGPYEIVSEIGRGGMGVVYKAFHPGLKRTVALKVMIAGEDASEEAIARFHREAEAVAKLGHHPNIVPVYDIGQVERESHVGAQHAAPLHYIAMHFVDGKPLDKMIDEGTIPPRRAAEIAMKVASALQHAHEHGILHRDIKPANILMARVQSEAMKNPKSQQASTRRLSTSDLGLSTEAVYEPLITDFGLAKDVESGSKVTASGSALGTPQYMPPEQADGRLKDVDARSDVYSLGATLYEMLTGEAPFEGETVVNVIKKVLMDDPASPRRKNPMVDKDLETICLKCLEKDRSLRYARAKSLGADLRNYLDGRPIAARPASMGNKILKTLKRHKSMTVAICISAAILACGAVVAGLAVHGSEKGKADMTRLAAAEAGRRHHEEKRRRSVEVVLAAQLGLGGSHDELRRAFYSNAVTQEAKRTLFAKHRESIDAFFEPYLSATADGTERATALAMKAWLVRYCGSAEEALSLFRQSQNADVEVEWGLLLELMHWFSEFLEAQRFPGITKGGGLGVRFVPVRDESASLAGSRESMEKIIELAGSRGFTSLCRVDVSLFRSLVQKSGDTADSVDSLSRALQVPELAWIRSILLFAKAKASYMTRDFDGALEDIRVLIEDQPGRATFHLSRAEFLVGKAVATAGRGEDPRTDLSAAIEIYDRAIANNPKLAGPYRSRSDAMRYLGEAVEERGGDPEPQYLRAIEDGERSISLDPSDATKYCALGHAHFSLGRRRYAVGADPRPIYLISIGYFEKYLEMCPKSPEAHIELGNVHAEQGRAQYGLGLDGQPMFEKSLEYFEKACKLDPDSEVGFLNKGVLLNLMGQQEARRGRDPIPCYCDALRCLDTVIAKYPEYSTALTQRGSIHVRMAQEEISKGKDPRESTAKAVEDYTTALRINPESVDAHTNRGSALMILGRYQFHRGEDPGRSFEKAIDDFERALSRNPGACELHSNLGSALSEVGGMEDKSGMDSRPTYIKAIGHFDRSLEINANHVSALNGRGNAYKYLAEKEARLGRSAAEYFQNAQRDFTAIIDSHPKDGEAYNNRGILFQKMGSYKMSIKEDPMEDFTRAVEDYGRALEYHGNRAKVLNNRGAAFWCMALAVAGKGNDNREYLKKAVRDYSDSLAKNPSDPGTRKNRANAALELGESEERAEEDPRECYGMAILDFEKYLESNVGNANAESDAGVACRYLGDAEGARGVCPGEMYGRAMNHWKKAVALQPNHWQAHMNMGLLFDVQGSYGESAKHFEKAYSIVGDRQPELKSMVARSKTLSEAGEEAKMLAKADASCKIGNFVAAREVYDKIMKSRKLPQEGNETVRADWACAHFNYACVLSAASIGKLGRKSEAKAMEESESAGLKSQAVEELKKAVECGWAQTEELRQNRDLDPLRPLPSFQKLMEELGVFYRICG